MTEETSVRCLFDTPEANNFIYRPPNVGNSNLSRAQNATLGVKFEQGVFFLDPWGFRLIGKTRWQRFLFRLRHPIAYSKRGWYKLYRKVRRFFIKDRMVPCIPRVWKTKEELLQQYPEVNNGNNKEQKNIT